MRWFVLLSLFMPCLHARATDITEILHDLEMILSDRRSSGDDHPGMSVDDTEPLMVQRGYQKRPLRVGAFNVQVFGITKMGKAEVVSSLLQILPRYDILLFQEIRDSSDTAFPELMAELNAANNNHYDYEISNRLGRSNSKEQYAYIYRSDVLTVEDVYQFPDPEDTFEREPYGVIFTSSETALGRFGFLGVHTKPDAAESEVDAMMDVYLAFKQLHDVQDVVMMGDFNADCSYVTSTEWRHIRMKNDSHYLWLVDDLADTTVSDTNCAYDRVVVAGDKMRSAIVADSTQVYRFDIEQGLDQDEAALVSDHYPVEFQLHGKVTNAVDDNLEVASSVQLSSGNSFDDLDAILTYLSHTAAFTKWDILEILHNWVTLEAYATHDVMGDLTELAEIVPNVLTDVLYSAVHSYIANEHALDGIIAFPGIIMDEIDVFTIHVVVAPQKTSIEIKKHLG